MLRPISAIPLLLTVASALAAPGEAPDARGEGLRAGMEGSGDYPRLLAQVNTWYGQKEAWPIEIDIKPGSETNEVRIRTERVFPIAIFGSDKLEVVTINPRTIRVTAADKKLVGTADTRSCRREDINGDSLEDLICNVKTLAFRLDAGDLVVRLVAETYEHEPLKAEATILIVTD